jgi:DNA-binding PadR family transcriptional regulator
MSNGELTLLSLLAEMPHHGYEIEQLIEQRGMREWTDVGFSSIYFLLNKLEKSGLITSHLAVAVGKGPARRIYALTPAGFASLKAGTMEALSAPQHQSMPIQIGLANLPLLSQEEVLAALDDYRTHLENDLQRVHSRWEGQKPLPYFVDAIFDHSITLIEAELNWVKQFAQSCANRPPIPEVESNHSEGK